MHSWITESGIPDSESYIYGFVVMYYSGRRHFGLYSLFDEQRSAAVSPAFLILNPEVSPFSL